MMIIVTVVIVTVVVVVVTMVVKVMVIIMMHVNVVVWVTIVGHQSTAIVVADKLNLGFINVVKLGSNVLTIHINDGFSLADCGSGKLVVHMRVNVDISTDKSELNAVCASRSRLRLQRLEPISMAVRGFAVKRSGVVVVINKLLVGRIGLSELLLVILINRRFSRELVLVRKKSLLTIKQVLARPNHGLIEGKLLAVKHEGFLGLVQIFLGQVALTEESIETINVLGELSTQRLNAALRLLECASNLIPL